jgi:acyl-CoA thioesterase YciA
MDTERFPAIRRILLPKDTNHHGFVFGGAIMAEIDLAGAVECSRHTDHKVVTVSVKEIEFKQPVRVGEVVTFWTRLVKIGTTSITVRVEVETGLNGNSVAVTAADVVYVTVEKDQHGDLRKVPVE